ncbi:Gfo/Idh/MocA family protein [Streptomyces venezuelae]|uniref:Gfo/Idh/MocA family protein n=1 Tax=Streptomyces venezuelae TaxID=54571 RepID=UPI0034235A37
MPDPLLRAEDYRPAYTSPHADELGIAVVGCGNIAVEAHLPAYARYGYRVVAVCDVVPEKARAAAERFGVPVWTDDLDVVLADPAVHVIDLTVQPHQRLEPIKRAAAAGKHVLTQKPLAVSFDEAQAAVELCESAGVVLMVNQQARWAAPHRALRVLVERGMLGHLYSVLHFYRDFQDFTGSWFVRMPYATTLEHGIHYFDLTRYFTGRMPVRVKAAMTMTPGQLAVTPMIHTVLCEYEPDADLVATLHFNNIVRAAVSHRYEWHLDGTHGSASATLDELRFTRADTPDVQHVVPIEGRWYIDAFAASMAEMLDAVATGRPPVTSGRDHLQSLRLAFSAIRSFESGAAVEPLPGGSAGDRDA